MDGILTTILNQFLEPVFKELAQIHATLKQIQTTLQAIETKENKMDQALTDLQSGVASIAADVTAMDSAVQTVVAFIQAHPPTGVADADIEAVVTQLMSAHTSLKASADALTNAVATPAASTPSSATPAPAGA
jgi:exonuclease VII small subunit